MIILVFSKLGLFLARPKLSGTLRYFHKINITQKSKYFNIKASLSAAFTF